MTEYRGDGIVPDANMIFDRRRDIAAPADSIWPWLVQLGKRRAGWYAPRSVERLIPPQRRALRIIEERYQHLEVGDTIPDYGGRQAQLELVELDFPRALIYRDERRGAQFSWAITLKPKATDLTTVHLRFRGRIASTGVLRRAILTGGEFFDGITGEIMLRGLQERVEER